MKRISTIWTKNNLTSACKIRGSGDPFIEHISFNSKEIKDHTLFVAFEGTVVDSHTFIDEAIEHGAVAIIHSQSLKSYDENLCYIQSPHPRRVASFIASSFISSLPSTIVGVTGTDGKSTTSDFIYQLMDMIHVPCGLYSSISIDDGSGKRASTDQHSSPEAYVLYPFLEQCALHLCSCVIVEATSIALSHNSSRFIDLTFHGAVFSTISSDHLNYHNNLESYVDDKLNLIRQLDTEGFVAIDANHSYIDTITSLVTSKQKVFLYDTEKNNTDVDISATLIKRSFEKQTLLIKEHHTGSEHIITLPYGQSCYIDNALGALLAVHAITCTPLIELIPLLSHLQPVEGRHTIITTTKGVTIVIDYAHTYDSFERIFRHAQLFYPKEKIIALFGAAGERDRTNRVQRSRLAPQYCGTIILSDEDPYREDPSLIVEELAHHIRQSGHTCDVHIIPNRKEGIRKALEIAQSGDLILLLAKGHQRSITYANREEPHHEVEVVQSLLQEM